MSLGAVLLRPQALATALPTTAERPLAALFELGGRLRHELESGGTGFAIIEEELAASLAQLGAEVEPRLAAAATRLRTLTDPIAGLASAALRDADMSDAQALAAAGRALLDALAVALHSLKTPQLIKAIETLFDVIEIDLGLSETRFRSLFAATIDRVITRLQADPASYSRFALGAALSELRRLMSTQDLGLPPIGKSTILPLIAARLQALGYDTKADAAASLAGRASHVLAPLPTLLELFPSVSFGPGSLGAAAAAPKTAWYASWLANQPTKSLDPLHADGLQQVDFDKISVETMEGFAFHTRWIRPLIEGTMHGISIETDDIVVHVLNILYRFIDWIITLGPQEAIPGWVPWLSVSVLTIVGGLFESRFNDILWLFVLMNNVAESQLYARWSWLARESLLSILTLLNNTTGRVNHNQIGGVAALFGELGSLLIPLIQSRADLTVYGVPSGSSAPLGKFIGYLIGGMLCEIAFIYLGGWLVSWALAGKPADSDEIGRLILKERIFGRFEVSNVGEGFLVVLQTVGMLASYPLNYFVYSYLFNENRTGVSYPSRDTSPYKLPWEKGKSYQCVQGNHGLWSHTPFSYRSQIFAYDFTLNNGDEALAMRDGIVWEFVENRPDNDHTDGAGENHVVVLHGLPPADGHDLDKTGTQVRTFAEYLHGKLNGVSDAFQRHSTPIHIGMSNREAILAAGVATAAFLAAGVDINALPNGTAVAAQLAAPGGSPIGPITVKQGDLIMLADNTGMSAFNHLHVHIVPNKGTPNAPEPGDLTIPLVFGDPDVAGDDGVPKSLNSYTSDNSKQS